MVQVIGILSYDILELLMKWICYSESPLPKHSDLFASFPSLAAGEMQVQASPFCLSLVLTIFSGEESHMKAHRPLNEQRQR